jgi:hypothetical protein
MRVSKNRLLLPTIGLAMTLLQGPSAVAENIITSGVICNNYNVGQANDIDYVNGVRVTGPTARSIVCSVPRARLPDNSATVGKFNITLTNGSTSAVTCTVYSYTSSITLGMGTAMFPPNSGLLTVSTQIPAAQLPSNAFTSLICSLPGNSLVVLNGVTSVQ